MCPGGNGSPRKGGISQPYRTSPGCGKMPCQKEEGEGMIQVSQEEYEQERTRDPEWIAFMIDSGRVIVEQEST